MRREDVAVSPGVFLTGRTPLSMPRRRTAGFCADTEHIQTGTSRSFRCRGRPVFGLMLGWAMILVAVTGCGRPVPAGMVCVQGKVFHDGKPLPDGIVNFEAVGGKGSGTGKITTQGAFEVVLPPGDYQVGVSSHEGNVTFDEQFRPIQAKSRIAERYESIATSGLTVTVTPRGDPLSINLEK